MAKENIKLIRNISLLVFGSALLFTANGCAPSGGNNSNNSVNSVDREEDTSNDTLHDGSIADAYEDYFVVGVSGKSSVFNQYSDLLYHFNSTSPEYDMKWNQTEREEGVFSYDSLDNYMNIAQSNNLGVRGHTLIWYQSTPKWVHEKLGNKCKVDENGTPITENRNGKTVRISDTQPNRELGLEVMRTRIESSMEYLGDKVYCWDVVNEALLPQSDAEEPLTYEKIQSGDIFRNGINDARHFGKDQTDPGSSDVVHWRMDWQTIIGDDFVEQAFKMADEVAKENGYDDMDLYYNDYELNNPMKRDAAVKLVKDLQEAGVRIDGIGEQAHYTLDSYLKDKEGWLKNFESMIQQFTALGIDVQLTELEITVNGVNNGKLTEQQEKDQAEMYGEIFRIARKYSNKYEPWKEGAGKVTGITFWGAADTSSSFSRIFNEDGTPKKAVEEIMTFTSDDSIADAPDTKNIEKVDDINTVPANTWKYYLKGDESEYEIVQNSFENDKVNFRAKKVGDEVALVYKPSLNNAGDYEVNFTLKTNKGCGAIEGSNLLDIRGIGLNGTESKAVVIRGNTPTDLTFNISYENVNDVKPIEIVIKPTTNFEVEISNFKVETGYVDPTLHNVEKIDDHNNPPAKDTWYYWLQDSDESKYEFAKNSFVDNKLTLEATKIGNQMRLVYLPNIEAGKTYELSYTITVNKDCSNVEGNKFIQFMNYGESGSGSEWMTLTKDTPIEKTYEVSYSETQTVKPLKFVIHPTTEFNITVENLTFKEVEPEPEPGLENNVEKIADHNTPTSADNWYYWQKGTDAEYSIETRNYQDNTLTLEASNIGNELRLVYLPTLEAGKTYTMSFVINVNKNCGTEDNVNKHLQLMNFGEGGTKNEWMSVKADTPTKLEYEISYSAGQTVKPIKFIIQSITDFKLTISDLTFKDNNPDPVTEYDVTKIADHNTPSANNTWFYWMKGAESSYAIETAKASNDTLNFSASTIGEELRLVYLPEIELTKSYNVTFKLTVNKECGEESGVNKLIQLMNCGNKTGWLSVEKDVETEISFTISYSSKVSPIKLVIQPTNNLSITITDFTITAI